MEENSLNQHKRDCIYVPQPIRDDGVGATDLGPRDIWRDIENPDLLVPPVTDSGLLPNLKFSFSDAHMILKPGGWSREITTKELPVSTTIAGVNMRLTPGGVREAHWHQAAEWSYMIFGRARVTAVDEKGRNFIADIGPGDLWYFPPGIPHTIQGLEEGCEFLLAFDDGNFSETNTLSLSDWMAHTPKDVLAVNFGIPESAFRNIPKGEVYMYQGTIPKPLEGQEVLSPYGTVPESFTYSLLSQKPIICPGGTVRIADSYNFHVSKTIAAALVQIYPGAMRELHWHPNNDEWQYYLSGQARMTVFGNGAARTFDYRAGDVGYAPFANGHYIQNTGKDCVWFLEMFKSDRMVDISLNQWLAVTPRELIEENIKASPELMNSVCKEKLYVVKYPVYSNASNEAFNT